MKKYGYCFVVFVAVYAFCIIYKSSPPLMSGDDALFFMQLQGGNSVWHGMDFDYKRFFPLAGWNLNLIALLSTNPYAFMIGNGFVFIITAYCYYMLVRGFGVGSGLILLSFVLLTLSVGYTKIITQITFPETTQIMFLMAFLLCAKKIYCFANKSNAESKQKNNADSANYAKIAESSVKSAESNSYIYIYIYIYHLCPVLREFRHISQRSFIYFN